MVPFSPLAPGISASVQKIIKQGNHFSMLITNLLETAQLDAMQGELNYWPFDVQDLLDEVVEIVPTLIDDKPIGFECDYQRNFPRAVTNPEKLKQVLGCLLENAVKFTEHGKIVLGTRSLREGFEFWVEDTGIGIEASNIECIFDGFRQVDDENQRRYGGLGLGLYLSRQWLNRLGGYIDVESVIGHGSRFRVWLPHRGLPDAAVVEQAENSETNVPSGLLSTDLQTAKSRRV